MDHWWVNQNQTYKHEVRGGYMWSPKTNANGARNPFYDNMTKVRPGDIVFSFYDTAISAIGVVAGDCETAPKPTEFGSAGEYWQDVGWYVPVEFIELRAPIRPKAHMDVIGPTLPDKYSPLQDNGNGNQAVYLTHVPDGMAKALRALLAGQVEAIQADSSVGADFEASAEERKIRDDKTIQETERAQLIKARVGQGLFRSRVELLEPACRLTGVTEKRLLRASHIKPWAKSTNAEKLDGANGLLLAPHVDLLFDKGLISFEDDGHLIISKNLPQAVLDAWGLVSPENSRPLSPAQAQFMAYHRKVVFKR